MVSGWRRLWVEPHIPPESNPLNPPKDGKCLIDDLPEELLSYIFQVGVDIQEAELEEGHSSFGNDEGGWEDVDDEDDDADAVDTWDHDESVASSKLDSISEPLSGRPFLVLVSHICRRWRSVALGMHNQWTTLSFGPPLNIERERAFIARSNGLPLSITIDCAIEDEDLEKLEDARSMQADLPKDTHLEPSKRYLSQVELGQILDILRPEVYHWGRFIFYGSTYDYVEQLMRELHSMPMAPVLESIELYIYADDCDDDDLYPGQDNTPYLPFEGHAPNLKEAIFWGIHLDWEGATPNFLSDLQLLELSYLTRDVRPSYSTFRRIITSSPELRTLNLNQGGPCLEKGVAFDSEQGWGREKLDIPSLRELALQFHDPPYASALIQHLSMPNVTHLVLNFDDDEDYSDFVQTLAKPTKGQERGLLQNITHLEISELPCTIPSVELLLSQLTVLQNLKIKVLCPEDEVVFAKLIEPGALTIESESTPATQSIVLPKLFCPRLEELTSSAGPEDLKRLIIARQEAGAPLRKVNMVMSSDESLSKDEETWLRSNVEELHFFEPSDSEEEDEEDSDEGWDPLET